MLEAAADRGWLDRRAAALETLTAIARAGADIIITYLAADVAPAGCSEERPRMSRSSSSRRWRWGSTRPGAACPDAERRADARRPSRRPSGRPTVSHPHLLDDRPPGRHRPADLAAGARRSRRSRNRRRRCCAPALGRWLTVTRELPGPDRRLAIRHAAHRRRSSRCSTASVRTTSSSTRSRSRPSGIC